MIDIVTIGAGGGSIAHIDSGGALKVGPKGAGAKPGPACYNVVGTEPTVTDANIVLGKLNQAKILGGRMKVYPDLAEKALRGHICDRSSLSLKEAAAGIISVVNSNMMRAIRVVSVERGYDVRDFALMAFGGAGPLHSCEVANGLGIRRIIIPQSPGTLCSLGLLLADTKFDLSRSNIMLAKPENLAKINKIFGAVIIKSAYSTNIKERKDVSTGIIDSDGNMVAQAEHLAIHLGSFLGVVKEIYKRYPKENIKPGEMYIVNDPYNGGGRYSIDLPGTGKLRKSRSTAD